MTEQVLRVLMDITPLNGPYPKREVTDQASKNMADFDACWCAWCGIFLADGIERPHMDWCFHRRVHEALHAG